MAVTYTVITDTHGRPWGKTTADFDLEDNTISTGDDFPEAIHETTVNKNIRLYGNHDAAIKGSGYGSLQIYCDTTNKIVVYGFDCASGLHAYSIPDSQLKAFLTDLSGRPNSYNVIVLTHIPLYPSPNGSSEYYPTYEENHWDSGNNMSSANMLVYLLNQYKARASGSEYSVSYNFKNKTGTVIGCFSGHIHNSVKCFYKGIYMESFTTNGDSEYTTGTVYRNGGLYTPYSDQSDNLQHIIVDTTAKTVNGYSYDTDADTDNADYDFSKLSVKYIGTTNSGHALGDAATGAIKFYSTSNNYPKFKTSRYIGYSDSSAKGVGKKSETEYLINRNDAYWYVGGVTLSGAGISGVMYIRFDASGKLRYYSKTGHADSNFIEISGYQSKTITFTANGYTWKFVNGLYNGYTKA